MNNDKNTPQGRAVEALPRWHHVFELAGFLGHDGKEVARVAFVINRKADDLSACQAAHAGAAERAKAMVLGSETFKSDEFIFDSLKNVEALWRALRNPENLDEPAFFSPTWMLDNLEEDQLSALLRMYAECRKKKGPAPWEIGPKWIDDVRTACVAAAKDAVPTRPLSAFPREYLTDFISAAMVQWDQRERQMMARIAELEANVQSRLPAK